MENVFYEGQVLWSQIDANMHLRHSAYADVAAQARVMLLESLGLDGKILATEKLGPILFREELIYLKEVGTCTQGCSSPEWWPQRGAKLPRAAYGTLLRAERHALHARIVQTLAGWLEHPSFPTTALSLSSRITNCF